MQRTCDNCINRDWIKGQSSYLIRTSETCNKCCFKIGKSGVEPTHWELRPMTNADRIRSMSNEELAEFLTEWNGNQRAWRRDTYGELAAWLEEN